MEPLDAQKEFKKLMYIAIGEVMIFFMISNQREENC